MFIQQFRMQHHITDAPLLHCLRQLDRSISRIRCIAQWVKKWHLRKSRVHSGGEVRRHATQRALVMPYCILNKVRAAPGGLPVLQVVQAKRILQYQKVFWIPSHLRIKSCGCTRHLLHKTTVGWGDNAGTNQSYCHDHGQGNGGLGRLRALPLGPTQYRNNSHSQHSRWPKRIWRVQGTQPEAQCAAH